MNIVTQKFLTFYITSIDFYYYSNKKFTTIKKILYQYLDTHWNSTFITSLHMWTNDIRDSRKSIVGP
jgi:hypothetical protein